MSSKKTMMNVKLDVELNAEEETEPCQNQTTNKINVSRESQFLQLHPLQIVLRPGYQQEIQEICAELKVVKTTQEMVPVWAAKRGQHLASIRNLCQIQRLVFIKIKKMQNKCLQTNI